jgi:hypothetical protein
MVLQAEWTLMALAASLYAWDSAQLLYANEGLLAPRGRDGWALRLGSTLRLAGRELYVPSPLTLHRPLFRLAWGFEAPAGGDPGWSERRGAYRPLAPLVWAMAVALFVLLPLGLFSRLGEAMLIAALAMLYASILAALAWTALRARSLGIAPRRLAALAFELLVCPPFALNLVRRLSLEVPVGEDLVAAARRLQGGDGWPASRVRFAARLEDALLDEGEGSPRAAALGRYRSLLLAEEGAPCR